MTAPAPYRVAICVPFYRTVEGPTLLSCMEMAMRSAATCGMLPIGTSGCYVEENRNGGVQMALDTGLDFTHLLWIDGDMVFPGDALLRLLAHDKDIVGANYRQRTPPYRHVGAYLDGTDRHLMEPGLHKMLQLPTGLLLTKMDVYRKLPFPWFKPSWSRDEARDDVYFCHLARANGYDVWCDNDLTKEVKHISVQHIGWFDAHQIVEVKGTQLNLEEHAEDARKHAVQARERYEAEIAAE